MATNTNNPYNQQPNSAGIVGTYINSAGMYTTSYIPPAVSMITVTGMFPPPKPDYFAPNFADTIFGGVYRAIWRHAHGKEVKCTFYGEENAETMEYELSLRLSRGGTDVDLDMNALYETMRDGGEESLYAFLDTVIAMLPTPAKPTQEELSTTYMAMQQMAMQQAQQQMSMQQMQQARAQQAQYQTNLSSLLGQAVTPYSAVGSAGQNMPTTTKTTKQIIEDGFKKLFGKVKP